MFEIQIMECHFGRGRFSYVLPVACVLVLSLLHQSLPYSILLF